MSVCVCKVLMVTITYSLSCLGYSNCNHTLIHTNSLTLEDQERLRDVLHYYYCLTVAVLSANVLIQSQSVNIIIMYMYIIGCFLFLARYQVDLGYSPGHAVSFYEQAVTLDPGNGQSLLSPYYSIILTNNEVQITIVFFVISTFSCVCTHFQVCNLSLSVIDLQFDNV